jgi:hypothetical protein
VNGSVHKGLKKKKPKDNAEAGCCECGDEPSGSCATELVEHNASLPIIESSN